MEDSHNFMTLLSGEHQIDICKPILEQIPQLVGLEAADGKNGVTFRQSIDGTLKKFEVRAVRYLDDDDSEWLTMGIWDVTLPKKTVPAAIADIRYKSDHLAVASVASTDKHLLPVRFQELSRLQDGYDAMNAFVVAPHLRGRHLGETLLSLSLVLLEHQGIRALNVNTDTTRKTIEAKPQETSVPFKSIAESIPLSPTASLVKPPEYNSFYSRYSAGDPGQFAKPGGFTDTQVPTHLSTMQIHTLLSALRS